MQQLPHSFAVPLGNTCGQIFACLTGFRDIQVGHYVFDAYRPYRLHCYSCMLHKQQNVDNGGETSFKIYMT